MRRMGCGSVSRERRSARWPVVLVLVLAGGALAGCGGSGAATAGTSGPGGEINATAQVSGGPTKTRARDAKAVKAAHKARSRKSRAKGIAPRRTSQALVRRVDASSDATLAKGQAEVSAGAPSDAEVRREVVEAAKEGIVLPTGNTSESFAASAAEASISDAQALAVGASIPVAPWNPSRRPIADWIVPILQWASENGWSGTVTSGFRTYAEQAELNAAGDFSAPAGASNHESTAYPGGAVDVTDPSQLIQVLAVYGGPEKLIGGVLGPVDPEHFSATGD
jgi:hypothetical protein